MKEKKEEGNKAEEKKEEVKEEKKEEEKKDDEVPQEIVLKVDMHCEACARKVARALKGFEGNPFDFYINRVSDKSTFLSSTLNSFPFATLQVLFPTEICVVAVHS